MDNIQNILAQIRLTRPTATSERFELPPFVKSWRWVYDAYTDTHEAMVAAAAAFASDVLEDKAPRWLSFLGPSGVGKTMLMFQVVRLLQRAARERVYRVPNTDMGASPGSLRTPAVGSMNPLKDLDSYLAAGQWAENFDVLFVEDIGAGSGTMDKGSLKVIRDRIMETLQLRSMKWTLLDANLYRRDLADHFDGRIASRLERDGSVMIEIPEATPDYSNRKQ